MKRVIEALKANAYKDTPAFVSGRFIATVALDNTLMVWRHHLPTDLGDEVVMVEVKKLASIISNIGAEVIRHDKDNAQLVFSKGKRKAKVLAVPYGEFREDMRSDKQDLADKWLRRIEAAINGFEAKAIITLNYGQRHELVNIVASAMSNEETRYYLNGIHIGDKGRGKAIAATNGHILTVMPVRFDGDVDAIIPRQAIDLLKRMHAGTNCDVIMCVGENETVIEFECDGEQVFIAAPHIEARYPDYPRVIPDREAWMAFDAEEAEKEIAVMKKVIGMTRKNPRAIVFKPGGDQVELSCRDGDGDSVESAISGKRISDGPELAGFNPFYLEDTVLRLGKRVTAYMESEAHPCKFISGESATLVVLMPVKVR